MSQKKKVDKKKTASQKEQQSKNSADQSKVKGFWSDLVEETIIDTDQASVMGTLVEPVFERSVGLATNIGISFGIKDLSAKGGLAAILDSVNVANDLIKELNSENKFDENFCKLSPSKKLPDPDSLDDISFSDAAKSCLNESSIYQKTKAVGESSGAVDVISNILDLITELSRPASPAECINPYFDQFFNLIPLQFIINKKIRDLLKEALEELTEKEVQQIVREIDPCGAELETIITNKEIEFPDIFPLLTLPAIPTIPNINLYTILKRLIVEAICYAVCVALTPLLASLSKIILEGLNDFAKDQLSDGSTGSFKELVSNSLEKINLNDYIEIEVINQAILQNKVGGLVESKIIVLGKPANNAVYDRYGLWRPLNKDEEETALAGVRNLIREYFNEIFDFKSEPFTKQLFDPNTSKFVFADIDPTTGEKITRELGTKEMIYMLFGEYNCFTMADLLSIGKREKFKLLRLNTEKRIVDFYRFIGVDFDAFSAIDQLKVCPPEPCEKLDKNAVDATQKRLSELCKILNYKSGLPPIPINEILKQLKLDQLFNQGVEQQFKILKNEYLLYLGFPSLKSFPNTDSITPFLPEETNSLNDYRLYSEEIGQKVFKNFLLRNPSEDKLFWEYDNIDLNKNLQGSTLEDVCGEDETFEQTFVFIFNEIFKLDANNPTAAELNQLKDEYKKHYEKRVKEEYEVRPPEVEGTSNPCCKFKNTSVVQSQLEDGDDPASKATTYPSNATTEEIRLVDKMKEIYAEAEGGGSGQLSTIGLGLSLEEKCYICRRTQWFGKGNKSSLLAFLSGEGSEFEDFLNVINCKQFGFTSKKGNISGSSNLEGSNIDTIGKCPEKKVVEGATKEQKEQKEKDTKAGTAKATKWLDTWDGGETKTQGKIEVQFWDFYGDKYMWLDYGLPQWWGPLSDISIGRINTDNQLIKTKYSKSVIGRRNIILKLLSFMNKKDKKALKSKKYDEKPWNS